jgi:hypothetical protein
MGSTRNIRYGAGAGPTSVFEYEYSTSRGPIKVQREGLNLTGAIKKFIPFKLPIEILRPPLVSRLPAQKLLSPHTETQAKKQELQKNGKRHRESRPATTTAATTSLKKDIHNNSSDQASKSPILLPPLIAKRTRSRKKRINYILSTDDKNQEEQQESKTPYQDNPFFNEETNHADNTPLLDPILHIVPTAIITARYPTLNLGTLDVFSLPVFNSQEKTTSNRPTMHMHPGAEQTHFSKQSRSKIMDCQKTALQYALP